MYSTYFATDFRNSTIFNFSKVAFTDDAVTLVLSRQVY